MYNENDTVSICKMIRKLAEMIGTNAENIKKLGGVVETNTNNLNTLAIKVLELEKRLNDKK